jgi:methyl-accepting chemotaxis protein
MNPESVHHVRQSWALVEPITAQAAELFYGHLFAADPAVKSLFKGDMKAQGQRLMQMIGVAVNKLDAPEVLIPALQGLGRRHVPYGVRPAHYPVVGAALLKTLEQGLGAAYTPAVHAAWAEVYGVMAQVMIEAAESGAKP